MPAGLAGAACHKTGQLPSGQRFARRRGQAHCGCSVLGGGHHQADHYRCWGQKAAIWLAPALHSGPETTVWLQDSKELANTEQAISEAESLSAEQQPDSPTTVQGTGSAGSNATAGVDIPASHSSAGTQSPSPAGTLQAQRQSSPTSGLNRDVPPNSLDEVLSLSQTGNSSTGSRQLPEREQGLSGARSDGSNRSPGRLADAHQAARLRGGNQDAAQLQQQQQRSDAELDPEHVSLLAKLPASIKMTRPQISRMCAAQVWAWSVHLLASAVVLRFLHAAGQPPGAFSSTLCTTAFFKV